MFLLITLTASVAFILRFLFVVLKSRRRRRFILSKRHGNESFLAECAGKPYRVLCVLGSGGHTAEMMSLVGDLLRSPLRPSSITYLSTASDDHSVRKAMRLHEAECEGRAVSGSAPAVAVSFATVPRAREVYQPWLSSVFSSVACLLATFPVVVKANPGVVLVNGPGSAVITMGVVVVLNALGLTRAKVIYVESIARTTSLSLSGRIIYQTADRFIVQWPGSLLQTYPLAEYHGRLT